MKPLCNHFCISYSRFLIKTSLEYFTVQSLQKISETGFIINRDDRDLEIIVYLRKFLQTTIYRLCIVFWSPY